MLHGGVQVADVPETIVGSPADSNSQVIGSGRVGRLLSLIFLTFLGLCIVLPLLQTIYPIVPQIAARLDERRPPSPFPSPRLLFRANGDFANGLNAWFDDRVGFRDLFTRAKNQIDYSVFGTSSKVLVGSDGWLFAKGNLVPVDRLRPDEFADLEQGFVTLARRLRAKGVTLIVIGYPDKSVIYPEKTPPQVMLPRPSGNQEKLRQFLASRTDLTFIDAEPILKREKSRSTELLYFKTDMHVSEVAQVPIVKEIIARIAAAEGRPEISWSEKFSLAHDTVEGGSEGRFLSLLAPVTESDHPYFKEAYAIGGTETDGSWYLPKDDVIDHADLGLERPFDWEFRSLPDLCPQRLPGMVLFGNSFSDLYWALGLHRYFCFIRRVRDPISRLDLFIKTMPAETKYFIFEYIQTGLALDPPPPK